VAIVKFDDHPDWDSVDWRMSEVSAAIREDAERGLRELVDLTDAIADDGRLCLIGVELVEALLDIHADSVIDQFEEALRHHANLRKALSCAWPHLDASVVERLREHIGPDEDIGRTPAAPRHRERVWERTLDAPLRDVRVKELVAGLAAAARAGLENDVEPGAIERAADPGAAHFLWPRYRCTGEGVSPFYRCGVRLELRGRAVVAEVDLLQDDVESLPRSEPWRIAAVFRSQSENLPVINESA
jgi:hypothetical protein